ncbi:cyclophilin-like fold protein [Thalassoglobus sp. JC818]|uniref:cyclophilin-like fold protein n=1 Tax=Thalassoglobus sp. JC818 TaxID=3232136 RepID=UPI0034598CDB
MPTPIRIVLNNVTLRAELNDSETAQAIAKALPLEAKANWWGDEIYFQTPVACDPEPDARADFGIGELGYWPPANAFCIFYGPTPISNGGKPKMANRGNPIGWLTDGTEKLHKIIKAATVRVVLDQPQEEKSDSNS